jgi:hypothetical protein
MAKARRDDRGLISGTLDYGSSKVTVVEHVVPILFPCTDCRLLTWHVLGSEHAGLGFHIPFVGTVASTHKRYGLLCNICTTISGVSGCDLLKHFESKVLPQSVCAPIDRFLAINPHAPPAYSKGFAAFMCKIDPSYREDAVALAAYTRYDRR